MEIARLRARPSVAEAGAGRRHRRTEVTRPGTTRALHLRLRSTTRLVAEFAMISLRAMLLRPRSVEISAWSRPAIVTRLEMLLRLCAVA